MKRLGLPGTMVFDNLRSIRGPAPRSSRTLAPPTSKASLESLAGSPANSNFSTEKLVKEHASMKVDLEMTNFKLKKADEQIHILESKLQDANNENTKITTKQKEDEIHWKELEEKTFRTKTICDQLSETLQILAGQTHHAEEDKKFFEQKLLQNSKAIDGLNSQVNGLSVQLERAEEAIRNGKEAMKDMEQEKEETIRALRNQLHENESLARHKDTLITQLEESIEVYKARSQTLDTNLQELQNELALKDAICKHLEVNVRNLETEKSALQSVNEDSARQLAESKEDIHSLENRVHDLISKLVELDKYSSTVSDDLSKLVYALNASNTLAQEKDSLTKTLADLKFSKLLDQFKIVKLENDNLKSEAALLENKILEHQKEQEFVMVQHADECRLTEDRIRNLEAVNENLLSRKNNLETHVATLEKKVSDLADSSCTNEKKMNDLLNKISGLELENDDIREKMQLELDEKNRAVESLKGKILNHEEQAVTVKNQISELNDVLAGKEKESTELKEKHKLLDEKLSKLQTSLVTAECKLSETRKQHDLMLESKQSELSKHLKEISLKNDQAINEIRNKYDAEKSEIMNTEKQKAEIRIKEMERKFEDQLADLRKEASQHLTQVLKEHAEAISKLQEELDKKELGLKAHNEKELERVHLQSEIQLREKLSSLNKEHELHVMSMRRQHDDECEKLKEELHQMRAKYLSEEQQRAGLELKLKVINEKTQQDNLEVISKKELSISSIKNDNQRRKEILLNAPEKQKKDIDISQILRTPVANMLLKVEKENNGNCAITRRQRRKPIPREGEVEPANAGAARKRRKTKNTSNNEDPSARTPGTVIPKTPLARKNAFIAKKAKEEARLYNIGDLFSEGSLNPYSDDPYAFD